MTNRYETHLTLAVASCDAFTSIRAWAEAQEMKWTHILLDRGLVASQPMVTFWGNQSVAAQHQRAASVAHGIKDLGGAVVRVKIEAALDNDDVPQTDADAVAGLTNYFEHHVKVLLSRQSDLGVLSRCAVENDARLSQNTLRRREDGCFERFVTQRIYGRGRIFAKDKLHRLLAQLSESAFQTVEIEAEYVVFDSNISVDSGWLEPTAGGRSEPI